MDTKKYLPEAFLKEYESGPIMLEPWDPVGHWRNELKMGCQEMMFTHNIWL